eukprot:9643576-Alexandrium_andersonii.AAC.1
MIWKARYIWKPRDSDLRGGSAETSSSVQTLGRDCWNFEFRSDLSGARLWELRIPFRPLRSVIAGTSSSVQASPERDCKNFEFLSDLSGARCVHPALALNFSVVLLADPFDGPSEFVPEA